MGKLPWLRIYGNHMLPHEYPFNDLIETTRFPSFIVWKNLMNEIRRTVLHCSCRAVMILGYFFILGNTNCTAQSLPFLPDELTQVLESGLPKILPSPVETGSFKKLPAGDGFVWLAESTATLGKGK